MTDVLLQNALKNNAGLRSKLDTLTYGTPSTSGPVSASAFTTGSTVGFACTCCINIPGGTDTQWTSCWNLIPQMCDPTGSFKVCDTSGYFRCGASCTWVVPAGVTCAQFQLWGHGGGTSSQCCCGGAAFGPSGAYASIIMQVTPGASYVLCAGCAYCCYASQTTPGLNTCPSYVTGPNLTNFCAQGGCPDIGFWRGDTIGGFGGCCAVPTSTICGPSSCSGWTFCWDSFQDGGYVDYAFSRTTFCGSSTCGTVYGINGMYPRLFISPGGGMSSGFTQAAPIFGFTASSQCCFQYNGSTCHGCCFSFLFGQGFMGIPGQGGYAGSAFGGCNAYSGDSGRMGMVCVRYK